MIFIVTIYLDPISKLSVQTLAEGKARQVGTIIAGLMLIAISPLEDDHDRFLLASILLFVCLIIWLMVVKKYTLIIKILFILF